MVVLDTKPLHFSKLNNVYAPFSGARVAVRDLRRRQLLRVLRRQHVRQVSRLLRLRHEVAPQRVAEVRAGRQRVQGRVRADRHELQELQVRPVQEGRNGGRVLLHGNAGR